MRKNQGFTLVELLVVIIIVGILAAVAVPLMRGMSGRAVLTEAVTALGTLRTAERAYFLENNAYIFVNIGNPDAIPGINPGDFDGTYFSDECYGVFYSTGGFQAICDVTQPANQAARAAYARTAMGTPWGYIRMDQDGNITTQNIPNSGYPEYVPSAPPP